MTPPNLDEEISAHEATLETAPADEGAFRALEALYHKHDRFEDLVALYEQRARQGVEGGAGRLLAKAAELAHRRMRNTGRAESLYRQVLHADPQNAAALASMVEIYEERGDYPALAEALERQADRDSDPRAAARLYLRLGRVCEERLLRRDRAALFYARASRLAPDLGEARSAALRCQLALRCWSQAKRTLDGARERKADPQVLAAEYARLGSALIEEPLDHRLAMDAFVEALALDRAAPGASAGLQRLEATPRKWREEVKELLEQAGTAKERRTAARLCLHAAGLHAAYDPDGAQPAVALAERAILLAPAMSQAFDLLERYLGGRGDWRALVDSLSRLAGAVRDRAALSGIYHRLARIDLVRFADPGLALEALERALALDPAAEPQAQQAFELHLEAGRRAEALAVLERHLAAAPERPQHGPWRLHAAQIAMALGDGPRARSHLEAARRADPRSPRIAAALSPLLEGAGEWRGLTEALETQVQAEPDPARRARILQELGRVHLERLKAPRDAFRRLAQALSLDPGRPALYKAIDAAAAQGDLFPDLARAYRAAADSPAADARAKKALLRRSAEVWDRDLGQPEKAVEAWRELVARDPHDAGAQAALEACLVRAGRLGEVAEDLRRRIEVTRDPAERRELMTKLARSHEEAGDPEGAVRAWKDVLASGPENEQALRGLATALEALGPTRAQERFGILTRLAGRLTGTERAEVDLARAALLEAPLGRFSEAAAVLLELLPAGGLSPDRLTEAVTALEALLTRGVEPVRIAQALVPVYAARGEPAKQVAMLELLAQRVKDEDGRARARLYLDAAALREERLNDPRGALSAASAALRSSPSHDEARRTCERLARAVGAHAELFALFTETASRMKGRPEEERALRARAAQIAEEDLGDADEAAAQLRRCLSLAPGDAATLAALTRVALGAERWQEASELLRERADKSQGIERSALLAQLAETLQERLGNPAAAAQTYEEAAEAAPEEGRPRLLARLAAALGAAGDPTRQAEVLAEIARRAPDTAEAAEAARNRALLQMGELADPKSAIEYFRGALLARPGDGEARAALEKLCDRPQADIARAAAEALVEVSEAAGDPRRVLAALERLGQGTTGVEAARVDRRVARVLRERLGEWPGALAALRRAVKAAPEDATARREMLEAAARLGAEAEAAKDYEAFLPRLTGSDAAAAFVEFGRLEEARLHDAEKAARAFGEALRFAPGELDALRALVRLHRDAGRAADEVKACLELAKNAVQEGERLGALRQAARVLEEKLNDPAGAAEVWQEVAKSAPDDPDADAALERLFLLLGRHEELTGVLSRRRSRPGAAPDPDLAFRLAELKREGDPSEVLPLLEEVLRARPGHPGARKVLLELALVKGGPGQRALELVDRALEAEGAQEERVRARERRLSAVGDPAERAGLHAQIRSLYERELRAPARAFEAAARAYAEDGLVAERAEPELVRLAEENGLYDELAGALEAAAGRRTGGEAQDLVRRAARLRMEKGSDRDRARAAYEHVLEFSPDDPEALEALEKLLVAKGDPAALEKVVFRRAALAKEADRAPMLVRLAEEEERMGDGRRAIAAAEEALRGEPNCTGALELLNRLYAASGEVPELSRILKARASREGEDPGRRLEFLLERARLLEKGGDGREALEACAEILAESRMEAGAIEGLDRLLNRPETRDAAGRILEDVYRFQGDTRRLAALLETRLESADAAERPPLLAEIAALRERLGERAEAFVARAKALREIPPGGDDPVLRADLERLAAAAPAFDELATAYEEALARGLSPQGQREVLRQLASLYADRLSAPDKAARALETLAASAPEPEALAALARVYRGKGAYRELASALTRQASMASSPEAKKELLLEVATVMEEQLSDREGALETYRQILAIDPQDPNALRTLGRLLGAAERWEDLVQVLEREVAVTERQGLVAEAAELRCRLGRIRQQRLADVEGALAAYREVLAKVPRHPHALAALEELARSGGKGADEAAALLEPIYGQEGEHARRLEMLEVRALSKSDPSVRAGLLRQMAELQAGPLRQPEAAFLTAARAVREDPDQAESFALAARIAREAGLEEELAALIAEVADRPRAPRARLELRRHLAHLAARGGEPGRAAEAWSRVLELSPEDPEALDGLVNAVRATGDGDVLAQLLRRRLAIEEEPKVRASLLSELAHVLEAQKDPSGAIGALRRLLELEPDRREALEHLDHLCLATERWAELAEVLEREVAASRAAGDAAGTAALQRRLAELREVRLLDREGAIALCEEILAARADDEQALARLEALLAKDPANVRAAGVLERAYASTGSWAKYASVLELRAGERPDPVERKALFLELAEVREKRLANPELAFVALCRAFRDDPADPDLRAGLQRLATATSHGEELAALYEEEFDRLSGPTAAEVALTLGALHERELRAPDTAVPWFERARRLDPSAAPAALSALDRLLGQSGRHADLAEVIEAEAKIAQGEERSTLLMRLGQLFEEPLSQPDRAVEAYQAILAQDARHVPALRALERHYEAKNRLPDLAYNLAVQRELATEPASRLRLAARLATTRQALGEHEAAAALWREVVGQDPRHEPALAALEALYEKLERWPELAELLRARLALTADRREAARMQERLGSLLGGPLNDRAQAVRAYQAVLDADPRNKKALEALRDLHEAQGDLEGLASAHRRLIPLQEDAAGVKAVRMQLADVLLRAGKKGEAAEQGRRALELEPHDEADLARLAEIFEGAGALTERVKTVEARAALLAEAGRTAEAVAAYGAAAEAWERPLSKPEAAAAALEKVLELEPGRRAAFESLRQLYAKAGNWRAYVRVCDLFTGQLHERAEKVALLKELAEIHEKRLGQKEMAFVTLCRAFAEDPSDRAVTQAVERLAADTEAFDELAAVYEQVSEDAKGLARARLLIDLGKLRDQKLDDADGAEVAFRKALEVDPASPEALDALTDLFTRRGRVRDLVIALEQKLEAAAGLEEKKATLLEMARIYDGQLKDPGEAIASLRRVLELDGADAEALSALATLYRRESRWGELVGILARARDLAQDDPTRIVYQLQISSLNENEIGDVEAAVEGYRGALGLDDRQRDALLGLERLYTKLDRFAELNRVYEKQAEIATDPRERVRILGKSASIWEEKLGDTHQAIACYEAVLGIDGGNLPAVKNLEPLYRREGQAEKLIAVLQHHATLTQDRREQVSLEVQIGEVWWKDLARVDRAEAMFSHALQIDPESLEAISALGRLYERSGNWNLAIEMLQREAKLGGKGADVVEVQARIGRIEEEMLQDRPAAKVAYARALDADPGHLPSLRALRAIAESERNREAYLRYLLSEARYTESDLDKATLLHEAGKIHQDERDDPDGAARLYEEALKKVPDFLPAARPLADLYVAHSDWPRAEAVLDVVVKRLAQEGEAKELCRQSYRLGYVAEKLGKRDKALECHRRAYELDATYLPALEGLGNLLVQEGSFEEALKIFQAILIHHRDSLTDLEVVETYWQIGEIQAKLGQVDRAGKSFEKALEIDTGHEPSRRSLVGVLETMGDFEAAVEHRQKLLTGLEGEAKLEMLKAIGATSRDQLKDPYQAIDAFNTAARLDPGNVEVTEALLGLYRETRQGQKAADVLARLIDLPAVKEDKERAARLHHALALILRDELADPAGAARELDLALDADPKLVQAFADLETLLTRASRWADLEKAYLSMIQRLPKGPEAASARVALWKTLGELYQKVLNDPEKARMAYEVVASTTPDDAAAVAQHAELAAKVAGHEPEAIAAQRRLLVIGGSPEKAVSALVGLHVARKSFDQAYSAAQVLTFLLGASTPEESQVVTRLRRFARDTANGALDEALFERIIHERARGTLAAILALLTREASDLFVQQPKDLGLSPKKDEVDLQSSMLFFVNMLKYAARTLGLPIPRLYRPGEAGSRLQTLPLPDPSLIAGEELFQERPKKELWFVLGKALAFLRPELTLARFMPHDQLEAVFQAAVSLGTSRFAITADLHLVERLKRRLEKSLPEATRTQKLKLLARAYCDEQQPGGLRAYLDAVELTANRVGTLLAADLEVARKMVLAEKATVSKLKQEARLRDLVTFCTSEDYGQLRERLGLSVLVPASP